jgi:hypothetical protein
MRIYLCLEKAFHRLVFGNRNMLIALVLLFIFVFSVKVNAQETTHQFWPEVDAFVRLSPAARLFFSVAPVWSDEKDSYTESSMGAFVEAGILPIFRKKSIRKSYDSEKLKYLRTRIGYERVFTREKGGFDVSEQRLAADVTGRFFLPMDILVAVRNRFDFRWLDKEFSWRYRPRLWLERESQIGKFVFVPYAMTEVFYDSRFQSWSRTRYQAGVSIPATKWLVPEVYFLYEINRHPSKDYLDAIGLVATLYF